MDAALAKSAIYPGTSSRRDMRRGTRWELPAGMPERVHAGTLIVERGLVWITWPGSGDIIVKAGESCRVGKGAIVQAIGGETDIGSIRHF